MISFKYVQFIFSIKTYNVSHHVCTLCHVLILYDFIMNIDIGAINKRIDQTIAQNKRSEHILIFISTGMFLLAIGLLIIEILSGEIILVWPTMLINAFLYWPIKAILRIKKENVVLNETIVVLQTCPAEKAIIELERLWAFMREEK